MKRELEGKVAIVVGATCGIGKEIGLALAQNGADILLVSDLDKLERIQIEKE